MTLRCVIYICVPQDTAYNTTDHVEYHQYIKLQKYYIQSQYFCYTQNFTLITILATTNINHTCKTVIASL